MEKSEERRVKSEEVKKYPRNKSEEFFLCCLDKIDAIHLIELFNKVINHLAEYTFSAIIEFVAVFAMLAMHNNMIKVLISKMRKSG